MSERKISLKIWARIPCCSRSVRKERWFCVIADNVHLFKKFTLKFLNLYFTKGLPPLLLELNYMVHFSGSTMSTFIQMSAVSSVLKTQFTSKGFTWIRNMACKKRELNLSTPPMVSFSKPESAQLGKLGRLVLQSVRLVPGMTVQILCSNIEACQVTLDPSQFLSQTYLCKVAVMRIKRRGGDNIKSPDSCT